MRLRQRKRKLNISRRHDTRHPWRRVQDYGLRCFNGEIGNIDMFTMITPELSAHLCYSAAQFTLEKDSAIQKVHNGIACFPSLELALKDAENNIAQYTKSDFPLTWFYEFVKAETLKLMNAKP